MRFQKGDSLFDGFMHRPFNEDFDGWRNEIAQECDYQAVQNAVSVLALFRDLQAAQREVWNLRQELRLWKPMAGEEQAA